MIKANTVIENEKKFVESEIEGDDLNDLLTELYFLTNAVLRENELQLMEWINLLLDKDKE